jgi:hypothetical protein
MHACTFLHNLLNSSIHKSRLKLLTPMVDALLRTKTLKLTTLGRALDLPIQERNAIRKVDRFLGNTFFQTQSEQIYAKITDRVIGNQMRPYIIVDWTKLPSVNEYAIRAACVAEGRALTLYEEVHPKKLEQNALVHKNFLQRLKKLLPLHCKPIIITDAGFKNPWFRAILNLEWDFIGRVRGLTQYNDGKGYQLCETLHSRASIKPQYLGEKFLSKKSPLSMSFYTVKCTLKGRKKRCKNGRLCKDKDSKNYSRSYREPWLLVSSMKGYSAAKKIVRLYTSRMTIEEAFRDLKSSQYGLSMERNQTKKRERLIVWLMLAALASLLAWIVGRIGEQLNLHYQFQANSIRHRRVLSFFYLGCEIIRKNIKIPICFKNIFCMDEDILL